MGSNLKCLSRNAAGELVLDREKLGVGFSGNTSSSMIEADRISDRVLDFFGKIKNMGLNDDDETSKSFRQLGLLSILSGFDKNVLKEATSKLVTNIVAGREKERPMKVQK